MSGFLPQTPHRLAGSDLAKRFFRPSSLTANGHTQIKPPRRELEVAGRVGAVMRPALGAFLGAASNEWLASAIMEELATPVLHVAVPWAKRPAWRRSGCADNPAHDCADWPANHCPGDN